jgi:beta-phosphoglucomutase-like phosphatase (HAD superfamily)
VLALDGVLVDLGAARRSAYAEALAAEGLSADPAALDAAAWSAADLGDEAALADAVRASGAPGDEVAVGLAAHRAGRLLAAQLRHGGVLLLPGAAAAVAALASRLRLALVTALPRADALHVLDAAGLAPAFGAVVAGDDPPAGRPPRDRWASAADRLGARVSGLARAEVAALAGTARDVAAARAAGLRALQGGRRLLDGLTPATLHAALAADAAARASADRPPAPDPR